MKPLIYCLIAIFCQTAFTAPTFSLHNKSTKSIDALVMTTGQKEQNLILAPGKFADIETLDTGKKTNITIMDENRKVIYVATILPVISSGKAVLKTIYINWNPKRQPPLYPQRGPFKGLTGKTDLGYSTKNNVHVSKIQALPECVAMKNEFGVAPNAFRKASMQFHPDKCGTDLCKQKFAQALSCYKGE